MCTCGGRHWQFGVWLAFSLFLCIFNGYWLFSFPTYSMASEIIFCTGILHLIFRVQVTWLANVLVGGDEYNPPSPSNTFPKRGAKACGTIQVPTGGEEGPLLSPFLCSLVRFVLLTMQ